MWYDLSEVKQLEKRERIARLAETEADQILLARIEDRILGASQKNIPAATCFLSKREQLLAQRLLPGVELHFFGGYPEAERAVCCYVPDYYEADEYLLGEDGPIAALRASFYENDTPNHRDFLGALMACGIKRETVGDILVQSDRCDFLVTREIQPYVLQTLESAGRAKLRLAPIPLSELRAPEVRTRQIKDTVAALRLDSVLSSGFGLSRAKAALYVESSKTAVNWLPCTKPDKPVAEGDQISVRGLGKIELTAVGGISKKGRIGILISRYE